MTSRAHSKQALYQAPAFRQVETKLASVAGKPPWLQVTVGFQGASREQDVKRCVGTITAQAAAGRTWLRFRLQHAFQKMTEDGEAGGANPVSSFSTH